MKSRPPDLPDYGNPPVTEVVLGVQFAGLDRMLAPHLGLFWEEFRDRFSEIEQHPPLDPIFETFPEKVGPLMARVQLLSGAETPRVFFVSTNKNELLQVQRDRFIHNWRKINEAEVYPRFERLLETFEAGYLKLARAADRMGLGEVAANQCEVSYVNQISVPDGESMVTAFERIFGSLRVTIDLDPVGRPEDARFNIRYIMRDAERKPIGRLYVGADPAARPDGSRIVQFTLVARGRPASPTSASVREFLLQGRRLIVQSFDRLTSKKMHDIWEKRA